MISYLKTKNKYFFFVLLLVFIYIGQYLDRFEKEDVIYYKEINYDFAKNKLKYYNFIFFENILKNNEIYHARDYNFNVKRRPHVGGNLLSLPCSLEYQYKNSPEYPSTFKHHLNLKLIFYDYNLELEKKCINVIEKIHILVSKMFLNESRKKLGEFLILCIKKKNYLTWYPFLAREECNKILTKVDDIITADIAKQNINIDILDLITNNIFLSSKERYEVQNNLILLSFEKFFFNYHLMISKNLKEKFSKVDLIRKSENRSLVSANKYTILLIYLLVFSFILINKKKFKIKTKL